MIPRPPSLILLVCLTGCASAPPGSDEPAVPLQVVVPLLFYTDRDIDDPGSAKDYFGDGRGTPSYGVAEVAISTRKQGHSPFADWKRWRPRAGRNRDRNELISIEVLDRDTLVARAGSTYEPTDDDSVLLYIHGYRRDFATAAEDMARAIYEMNPGGVPILYSWPSHNNTFGYAGDLTNIMWSGPNLRALLESLVASDDVGELHVIAHSMGNFALLRALANLLGDPEFASSGKLGKIVLFAPDVDTGIFTRDVLPLLRSADLDVSLYVSAVDIPLRASQGVNLAPRLGDANEEIYIAEGVETVDVSEVATIFDGHSAYRDSAVIQADLHYLIEQELSADDRPTLDAIDGPDGRYWEANPDYLDR